MPALTTALLIAGALLSLAGLLGFCLVWATDPDRHDLRFARTIATAGQWAVGLGLIALWTGPARVGGAVGAAVTLAACAAVLSIATKAPLRHYAATG